MESYDHPPPEGYSAKKRLIHPGSCFFFSVNVLNPVFTSLIQIITPAVVAVVFNVVIDDGIGFFT